MKNPKPLIPLAALTLLVALAGCSSHKPSSAPADLSVGASASATAPQTVVASASANPTSSTAQRTASPTPTATESHRPFPTGTVITVEPTDNPRQEEPTAQANSQNASSAAGIAVCDYGQLYIEAAVTPGGAAGSRYITLTFNNTGSAPCAMSGYPAVHYVNSAGQQIGASSTNATEWSSSGGVLAPGQALTATLRETRAQLYGETCQSASATGYSIQAPGASQALVLNFAAEACSNPAITQLSVGAVGATP